MADTAVPLSQVGYTELRHFASFSSSLCTLLNESILQGAGYGAVIGLGALFALGMIGVTEVMKRRGNVENSEEFTGKQPSLRIWKKNILLIIDPFSLHSCEKISWDWFDCRRCDIFLDLEYDSPLFCYCCLRIWRCRVVLLRCLQQYTDHGLQ
jgi:hypothetical protein